MSDLWQETRAALLRCASEVVVLQQDSAAHSPKTFTGTHILAAVKHYESLLAQHRSAHVGLYLENSVLSVVAVLACVAAGTPFVPFDVDWPLWRIRHAIERVGVRCVLWADAEEPGGRGQPSLSDLHSVKLIQIKENRIRRTHTDDEATHSKTPLNALGDEDDRGDNGNSSDLAYIMFTSGSTGVPMAVRGTRLGILHRCQWMQSMGFLGKPDDVVMFKTSICFVDSVWEIFGPILANARVFIPLGRAVSSHSEWILECAVLHNVTHLAAVPSIWASLLHFLEIRVAGGGSKSELRLRQAVSSGEPLTWSLLSRMQKCLPKGCRILNLYGCTETAADSTLCDCSLLSPLVDSSTGVLGLEGSAASGAKQRSSVPMTPSNLERSTIEMYVPIGSPVPGVFVGMIPESYNTDIVEILPLSTLKEDVSGEIFIGSIGLADGYYDSSERNGESRFIKFEMGSLKDRCICGCDIPWNTLANDKDMVRVYRTGDLGLFISATNQLYIRGRKDMQIKIDGKRVDLLEVEHVLCQYPGLAACAVAATSSVLRPSNLMVAACLEVRARHNGGMKHIEGDCLSSHPSEDQIIDFCRSVLPSTAVPRFILFVEALPRTASGKIDRQSVMNLLTETKGTKDRRLKIRDQISLDPVVPRKKLKTDLSTGIQESEVASAFSAAFGDNFRFEPSDSLFELGGNSLDASWIANLLGISPELVIRFPSIRQLTQHLSRAANNAAVEKKLEYGEAPQDQDAALRNSTTCSNVDSDSIGPDHLKYEDGILNVVWRSPMYDCVDAAPIFDAENDGLIAISERGHVSCFNASSGREVWSLKLDRQSLLMDPGLALIPSSALRIDASDGGTMSIVVVVCRQNTDALTFVDSRSGDILKTFKDSSGLRTVPSIDPWSHCVWLVNNDQYLLVICYNASASSHSVLKSVRLPLPASASAKIAFASVGKYAVLPCLDGSVVCFSVGKQRKRASAEVDSPKASTSDINLAGGKGSESSKHVVKFIGISVKWITQVGQPVFATPSIMKARDTEHESVVVVDVKGGVTALSLEDGSRLWAIDLSIDREVAPSIDDYSSELRGTDSGGFFSTPVVLPDLQRSCNAEHRGCHRSRYVVCASRMGFIYILRASCGSLVSSRRIARSAITGVVMISSNPSGSGIEEEDDSFGHCLGAITSGGSVMLIAVSTTGFIRMIDAIVLPGPCFGLTSLPSSSYRASLAVGSRDDHIYCLSFDLRASDEGGQRPCSGQVYP